MKNLLFFAMFLLVAFVYADNEKILSTSVNNATVFINGARIERTGTAYLNAGNYDIIIESLPTDIDPNSIEISGKGNIIVLSVENRINYLKSQTKQKNILQLEDSLYLLQNQIKMQNGILAVYNNESAMILANKEIGGKEKGVDINTLKATADFFRTRLTEIQTKIIDIDIKISNINKDIARIQAQLNEFSSKKNPPTSEIVIKVLAKSAGNATFSAKYNVTNAGWIPMYDIRISDLGNPAKLSFKAAVFQNTGEDWQNTKLTLSTANPTQSSNKPILNPWYLYLNNTYGNHTRARTMAAKGEMSLDKDATLTEEANFEIAAAYTTATEYPINFEYSVAIPYSIEPNSKEKIIQLQEYDLPAQYQYFAAPKIENDAFLLARIAGWEKHNLLSGEANVFFQETFVGKSYINPLTALDTLDVSLGRDRNISVKREMIKDYTSDKFLGSSRKVSKGWEIIVKNNKNKNVDILLEDQFPISTNKEIDVEKIDFSGGKFDENTGKISWKLSLKPNETKNLILKYNVKYPKDKNVVIY